MRTIKVEGLKDNKIIEIELSQIMMGSGDFLRKDAHKIKKLLSENNIPCELTDREEKLGHTFCFQNPYRQE